MSNAWIAAAVLGIETISVQGDRLWIDGKHVKPK